MRVLFCRIGWAKFYCGDVNDKPINGGSYNKNQNNVGYETYNFKNYDGKYYGYVRIRREWTIHLERIENCPKKQDELDGVLVIWLATKKSGGEYIVGWYKDATVFRKYKTVPDSICNNRLPGHCIYHISSNDAVLLDEKERNCRIYGIGQFNYWFDEENTEKEKALKFIKEYELEHK